MKISDGFKVRLEFVLEKVFENMSCGGDHLTRAFVAKRLLLASQSGVFKYDDLVGVAEDALLEASQAERSASIGRDEMLSP
jgi:hypothetical protein